MIATSGRTDRTSASNSGPFPACPATSNPDRSSKLARPLAEIAAAHRVSEDGHVRGKLVLVVG
jgi:hypothetical protein